MCLTTDHETCCDLLLQNDLSLSDRLSPGSTGITDAGSICNVTDGIVAGVRFRRVADAAGFGSSTELTAIALCDSGRWSIVATGASRDCPAYDQAQQPRGTGVIDEHQYGSTDYQTFSTDEPGDGQSSDHVVDTNRIPGGSSDSLQGDDPEWIGLNLLSDLELQR